MRISRVAVLLLIPGIGSAQAPSAKAQQQIAAVARAAHATQTTRQAEAAGFHPVFGWLPTMGEHWVSASRMAKGKQFDLLAPDNLMFSRINGHDSLIGAAYAYFTSDMDATPPSSFDGDPAWHEHANLAPPGQTLVMLHVWFVPSPDGPFAGNNPNIPFWAVGLTPPEPSRLHDPEAMLRFRKAALALAETVDSAGQFPSLASRTALRTALSQVRDTVRRLIPEFSAAASRSDWTKWDAVAVRAAAQWDHARAAYLDATRTADGRTRVQQHLDGMLEEHGMHGRM